MAYKHANVTSKDIDLAEVHDCFTIAEICAIEDLGFVKKGEGGKAIDNKMAVSVIKLICKLYATLSIII